MFSRRSGQSREPNALARALSRAERARRPLFDLTGGNPTLADIPYDADGIRNALAEAPVLEYAPEPLGLRCAREAVSRLWSERGRNVDPARVAVTASTSEAYSFLFKLLCDPGDVVLVPRPSYPLFEQLARFESVRLVPYSLEYDGRWYVDEISLRRARSDRCRAVLAVSPNNPTGSFLKRKELSLLARLGLPIVCDEVFAGYEVEGASDRIETALELEDVLVFSLGGLSKLAGLPQAKLAWTTVGGPRQLAAEALSRWELIADAFLSASTTMQVALDGLLATRGRAEAAIHERVRRNAGALRALLSSTAATVLPIEGGWYAVVRLPAVRTEEQWVVGLVEEAGVVVQPGWFYDFSRGPFVVASLLTPPDVLAAGGAALAEFVAMAK